MCKAQAAYQSNTIHPHKAPCPQVQFVVTPLPPAFPTISPCLTIKHMSLLVHAVACSHSLCNQCQPQQGSMHQW